MQQTAARRLFYPAAAFNFAASLPFLIDAAATARLIGLHPVPDNLLYFRISFAAIAIFGWMYFMAGRDPVRYRPFIVAGIVGKLVIIPIVLWHWRTGDVSWQLPLAVAGDAIWAILFLRYLRKYPEATRLETADSRARL